MKGIFTHYRFSHRETLKSQYLTIYLVNDIII